MKKIGFTHHIPLDRFASQLAGFQVLRPTAPLSAFSREEALAAIRDATAFVFMADFRCDKDFLDAANNLRIIGNLGSGFDNIDVNHATQKGVVVLNTPVAVVEPTAEMTLALILGICRSTVFYDRDLRQTRLCKGSLLLERDMTLTGKTLGILGFGRIGRAVAKKALVFGMKIVYSDIARAPEAIEQETQAVFLPPEEVIRTSDVLTLHMPYNRENHHYINAERLSLMKPTAYLINASRGSVVSEPALVDALREKRIRGAALDVHEAEPHISEAIASLENIVITPHACTNLAEVRLNMMDELLTGVAMYINDGLVPGNVVNRALFTRQEKTERT